LLLCANHSFSRLAFIVKTKDNPPSLSLSLAFRQSKKAMVDKESKKTKVKKA